MSAEEIQLEVPTPASTPVTPGGNSGDIQFNNGGAFGGFADGSAHQILHGGKTFSAVDLTSEVSGVLPPANGGVAVVSVQNQGFFYGGFVGTSPAGITGSGGGHVANQLGAMIFVLPFKITVRKVAMRVASSFGVGSAFLLGIYSGDGLTKLIEASFVGTTTTKQSVTLATPVVLSPGVYIFVWGPTATGGTYAALATPNPVNDVNGTIPNQGLAANAIAAGTLPAATGALTSGAGNTVVNVPLALFY